MSFPYTDVSQLIIRHACGRRQFTFHEHILAFQKLNDLGPRHLAHADRLFWTSIFGCMKLDARITANILDFQPRVLRGILIYERLDLGKSIQASAGAAKKFSPAVGENASKKKVET